VNFTPLNEAHLAALRQIVGDHSLSVAQADLDLHNHDQSRHPAGNAQAVLWVSSTEQVSQVLAYCNAQRIAVTPWGVGTSLEGNPLARFGGVSLSLERMTRIVEVHADDFQVTVEPGIGHKDLNKALAQHGLFFPPDPGANATIGGMLANNAAGIRTVKYGASKDNVLKMRVVLADGRIIDVGSRSIKQSSGYDLLHLIVGSEGTLGVITQATLKLVPVPALMSAVIASFPTVEAAIEAVVAVRGSGLEPAALEFMDGQKAALLRDHAGADLEALPTLLMEFHALVPEALAYGLEIAREICEELGATHIKATADNAERSKLWTIRHHAYETMVRAFPGYQFVIDDVSVPISEYPALIGYARQVVDENGVVAYMMGHAGDGNIHCEFPYRTPEEFARIERTNDLIVAKAIALSGTATGEHGVGIGKAHHMPDEHGIALDVMRQIKRTLDPNGILNPGKIFPD
jgi:D-lactate dehydrogenase (cytochrome)